MTFRKKLVNIEPVSYTHLDVYKRQKQYRNLHVNEIDIDMDKETIDIKPSYQGAKQLENFNPYTNQDGSVRYVNATTASKSAGVKSLRDDRTVMQSYNGSPMVLDQINTGDWTKISGCLLYTSRCV